MVPMDIRFILDDQTIEHYNTWVVASYQGTLTVPSLPYSPLYSQDEIINTLDENMMDAMDDAPHSFERKQGISRVETPLT
jgi:hypothetical protein